MKTMIPPSTPIHDVTTQLHSDGNWWATCQTCGWHGPPCAREQVAMASAGHHHQSVVTPKKTHKAAWAVGLGMLFLIGFTAVAGGGGVKSRLGDVTGVSTHTVTYKVEGTTKQASITYENANGDTSQQSDIDVPLTRKIDHTEGLVLSGMKKGAFLYISAQNSEEYGSVTCIIEVDGVRVKENTSRGGYTIATCSGRL